MNHALPEPKHIAPPEFGDGLAQFLVERPGERASQANPHIVDYFPMVVWVTAAPVKRELPDRCGCKAYWRLTGDSLSWARSNFPPVADGRNKVAVCLCMGRFIE